MNVIQKKSKPRLKNEGAILTAAEEVFSEVGFAGATTSLIAKRAGIPKANLHYYYPTKEMLYQTIIDKIFTVWLRAAESFDDCDVPADALRRYIQVKMEISRAHPLGSKIWAQEIMNGGTQIESFLETTLKDWTESRVKIIERWVAEDKINVINPHYLLYMIWATTQHYADFGRQVSVLNGGGELSDASFAEATETVVQIILRGIGASDSPH